MRSLRQGSGDRQHEQSLRAARTAHRLGSRASRDERRHLGAQWILFSVRPPDAAAIAFVHYYLDINSSEFTERLRKEKSVLIARGESHQAIKRGEITEAATVELGEIVLGNRSGRSSDSQITVADLTGVAVQDIQIATAVYEHLALEL